MISEKDIVYITKKQASVATVIMILLGLLIFILGYFWGKQSSIDEFGQKITQDSLNDKNDYMQIMQAFSDTLKPDEAVVKEDAPLDILQSGVQENSLTGLSDDMQNNTKNVSKDDLASQPQEVSTKKYHAILIGFAAKTNAMQFVERLKEHDINVEIKSRMSRSASGKTKRIWYQIVTPSYNSVQEVQDVIRDIKKYERLKDSDIKIV